MRARVRSRPDDTHAALQDVEELRQLVERGPAQEGAEAGDARIGPRRLRYVVAVVLDRHGPELPHHDFLAAQAVAPLLEEDRAR